MNVTKFNQFFMNLYFHCSNVSLLQTVLDTSRYCQDRSAEHLRAGGGESDGDKGEV